MASRTPSAQRLREENERLRRENERLRAIVGEQSEDLSTDTGSGDRDSAILALVAESIPGALYQFVRTADGRYVMNYMSDGALALLGLSVGDIVGGFPLHALHPEDLPAFLESIERSSKTLAKWEHEYRILLPDGSHKWVRGESIPRGRADGSIEWNGILTDITGRKKFESRFHIINEQYRSIVEDQYDFIVHWKRDGIRTFVNDNYCRYYGLTKDDALGTSFFLQISESERQEVRDRVAGITPDNPVVNGIHRVIMPDGSVGWNEWTDRGIFDGSGRLLEYHSIGRDITGLMEMKDALRESGEKLRQSNAIMTAVMDNTFMMAVYLDTSFNFIWVNRAYAETCGHDPSFFPGRNHFELYPHEENQAIFQRVVDTGEPFFVEARPFEFPDQKERGMTWWDWSLRPVKSEDGTVTGLVFTLNEVTSRVRAEHRLRDMTRLLDSVRSVQHNYLVSGDTEPAFQSLLHTLITITDSSFGFLDEVLTDGDGQRYKVNLALSDISWDDDSKELYRQLVSRNLEFRNLDNLSGLPAKTGELVIANDVPNDPRSGGVPHGHPPIGSYMGIPLYFGGELVGVAGIANRKGGYDSGLADWLQPFLSSCAGLIHAVRTRQREQRHAEEIATRNRLMQSILDASPESTFLIDTDGVILSGNDIFARRLGMSIQDVLGRSIFDLIPPDVASYRKKMVKKAIDTREAVTFEDRRGDIVFSHSLHPVIGSDGAVEKIAVFGADITTRALAEEALRESEERYRRIVETAREGIWSMDAERVTTYVNSRMAGLLGYEPPDMLGKPVEYFMFEEDMTDHREKMALRRSGLDQRYERRFRHRDGSAVWTLVSATALRDEHGSFAGSLAMFTDITDRKRALDALRESEDKFRTIFNNAPLGIFRSTPEGRFIEVNPALASMLGHENPGEVIEEIHSIAEQIYVRSEERDPIVSEQLSSDGTRHYLNRYRRRDGSEFTANLYLKVVRDGSGQPLYLEGIVEDITEKIAAEEELRRSEAHLNAIFDSIGDIIVSRDMEARAVKFNTGFRDIVKSIYGVEASVGMRTIDHLPDTARQYWETVLHRVLAGERHTEQFPWIVDGETRYFEISFNPIVSGDTVIGTLEHTRDITDRKRDENRIKASLEEKELLLREIHHRVKNNLQVISSLLRLQKSEIADPEARKPLDESINRVRMISLIHSLLYQSETITGIRAGDFVNDLVGYLGEIFRETRAKVTFETDITDIVFGLDTAIPVGLILNELVTNALKYAFPDDRTGTISIRLGTLPDGALELAVTDDGAGLPPGMDPREPDSLGLRIVRGLVTQLDGTMTCETNAGTAFTFRFSDWEPR